MARSTPLQLAGCCHDWMPWPEQGPNAISGVQQAQPESIWNSAAHFVANL